MRVGIVNDLTLASEVLERAVTSVPGNTVSWLAADGAEAVRKAQADLPDVILMDLVMPVMDGVEATRRIMGIRPCPILIVTSSVNSNFNLVFEAMGQGAMDAVTRRRSGTRGSCSAVSRCWPGWRGCKLKRAGPRFWSTKN